ncbi:hypothetical protein CPC16_007027 [Podila verticillata]|nr:hypothetical protein CPC16_007027 [Podila verticillata]
MKGPKRKRKDTTVGRLVGIEDEKATLQAVQLVLRHQLWWLVHEKGFPKEIQAVAREYWAACLMNFRRYQDQDLGLTQPTTDAQEPMIETGADGPDAESTAGKKSHKKAKDGLDSMAEFQDPDSDTSSEDDDSDDQDDQDEREGDEEGDQSTMASTQTEGRRKPKQKIFIRKSGDRYRSAFDVRRPSLELTVAICYLASVHLKLPVIVGDFYREMEDIARVNPDLYGEFCKTNLMSVPEEKYQSLLRPFAATDYSRREQHLDGSGKREIPGIDAFIRHLYLTVPPPRDTTRHGDPSAPPPLRPGEGYVYYIPDPSETYLGHYGRLLAHVSNITATSAAEIERNVQLVEELLFTNSNTPVKVTSVDSLYADAPRRRKTKKKQKKIPEPLPQENATPIELDIFQWDKHQFAEKDFTIPEHYDTLERIDYDKVSREEFIERFEEKNLPVVIRGVMEGWGACKNWNSETFLKKYYSQPFKVGEDDDGNNVYVKMKYFLKYAENEGLKDDSPLYIFDSGFVKRKLTPVQKRRISGSSSSSSSSSDRKSKRSGKRSDVSASSGDGKNKDKDNSVVGSKRARSGSSSPSGSKKAIRIYGQRDSGTGSRAGSSEREESSEKSRKREEQHASTLLDDFSVPKYFKDDLFQLAGDRRRPPFRWFVVGGARSGTGIHIDPLGTSAWNTLTSGHKRWCLFPPGIPKDIYDPPMKPFDREAVSWFHHVYPRFAANDFELGKKYGMTEVIQKPGETMFVPGGWPHIVMNLDFTIAITQNFCSPTNFESVWLNTRHARPKLARKFRSELERLYNKTGRCFYKDLLEKCRSLAYVPMLRMSTDDSSSSSSSSSSDSDDDLSSTESESDIGEICMCHKCKKKRRKEARRANKAKKSSSSD